MTRLRLAFLPARRYANAGILAMTLCPCLSVCLSHVVGVLSKRMDGIIWFLAWELLSTSPTLCFKEIQASTKISLLPSGTFFPKLRT